MCGWTSSIVVDVVELSVLLIWNKESMVNKVLAILLLYWYWYGPCLYQKVLILVLVILFESKSIQYYSAILLQKFKHHSQLKRAVEIEHRSKETQQDCPTAFAHESHQGQTQVTAATPPAKDFFARITSKRNATVARPDMQMLRWNHIFQILLPNCRPWKPIQICAVYLKLNTGLPTS